ncbi:MAG TPA: hypothetical protein VHW00_24300 [Thermoanaerobaculia bacterium]|nr:hypothetical protein [Thermoanaerobaculia bacterium]
MHFPFLGRVLQLCGMIILPIALLYGLARDQIQTEVQLLALGGFLFLLGRILARDKAS